VPPEDVKYFDKRFLGLMGGLRSQDFVLKYGVMQREPVLTEDDVVNYCWREQAILLTAEGARRWNECGGWGSPPEGKPILVMVNGSLAYGAMLWNGASSGPCRMPRYWNVAFHNLLWIQEGGSSFGGEDPPGDTRFSHRVSEVMLELGKFKEKCEDFDY
jgi:hypothetical protein